MDYMKILLQQLAVEEFQELHDAKLAKVEVSRNGHYTFDVESHTLLPLDAVMALLKAKDHFPYPCDFHFQPQLCESQDILTYARYVFESLSATYPEINSMNLEELQLDHHILVLKACNALHKTQLESLEDILLQRFHSFGIDLHIVVEISSNNKDYEKISHEMQKANVVQVDKKAIEAIQHAPSNTQPSFTPKGNGSYKKEYTYTHLKDLDATMRDVAIQGYVFRSETITTRNGRQIQTLYVTDYTDSILVKRFEDKNKNAPEELAKLAKGGKWVKLKGTLEFDTYAKELA
ncbi:MAG: PolC-type DNA polymerase III, partial [Sharpea porci]